MSSGRRVDHETLRQFSCRVFEKAGLNPADAALVASVLVEADLQGVHTHGVLRLGVYARRLATGENNPSGRPKVILESPCCLLLDGDNALGQVVAVRAMELCIRKAQRSGIGVAAVRNSNDFTRGAYYTAMAAEQNLIGFATTNTPALLAPVGGTAPVVGNNPVSVAVPAGRERPIVLDMALSVVAAGKVVRAAVEHRKIPLGWVRDAQGRQTDDPEALRAGSLVPVGDYKGFGMALVVDVLAGVLPGALFATQLTMDGSATRGVGHCLAALDPAVFGSVDAFRGRVDDLIRQVRASAPGDAPTSACLPGEPELLYRETSLRGGIPLPDYVWRVIEEVARELEIREPDALA